MSNSDFISPALDIIEILDEASSQGNTSTTDDVAAECPICFDACTNQGDHRLVATRCGHLFGKSCLRKALSLKAECPACRKRCRHKEIVELYDCRVIAADCSVIDTLKAEVTEERMNRQKAEAERALINVKLHEAIGEIRRLQHSESMWRQRIESMQLSLDQVRTDASQAYASSEQSRKRPRPGSSSSSFSTTNGLFSVQWELAGLQEARILRALPATGKLLFSSRPDGGRFTITEVSMEDHRKTDTIASSDTLMRDIAVNTWPGLDFMCYTGDSKQLTVMSPKSRQIVMQQELSESQILQGWSCAFSLSSEHEVWVGASRGRVMVYDLRRAGSSNCHLASFDLCTARRTSYSQSQPQHGPTYCGNLIFSGMSSVHPQGAPVQSVLPELIPRAHAPSILNDTDEEVFPYNLPSTNLPGHNERIVVCQNGLCYVLHVAPDKASVESFTSMNSPGYVPNLSNIYDIHKTCTGPWTGSDHNEQDEWHGFIFACRQQRTPRESEGGNESCASAPSLRCVGLSSRFFSPYSASDLLCPHICRGAVITGHSMGVSASRPSSCVLPADAVRRHMPITPLGNNSCGHSDMLVVACPDEASRSVSLSATQGIDGARTIGMLPAHHEPVKQTIFTKEHRVDGKPQIQGIGCISSTQLRLYSLNVYV